MISGSIILLFQEPCYISKYFCAGVGIGLPHARQVLHHRLVPLAQVKQFLTLSTIRCFERCINMSIESISAQRGPKILCILCLEIFHGAIPPMLVLSTQSYLNHRLSVQPTLGIKRSAFTHFTFSINSKWIIPLLSNSQMLVDEKFPHISLLQHQSAQLASGKRHGPTSHSGRHDVGCPSVYLLPLLVDE